MKYYWISVRLTSKSIVLLPNFSMPGLKILILLEASSGVMICPESKREERIVKDNDKNVFPQDICSYHEEAQLLYLVGIMFKNADSGITSDV